MKIAPTTHEPIELDADELKKNFSAQSNSIRSTRTGKTFLTRAYAVAICNGQPLSEDHDANKFRYDQLCADGRVKFVTFHQNYGYEDFIESIKPTVDANGNISYRIADGVFKNFRRADNFD